MISFIQTSDDITLYVDNKGIDDLIQSLQWLKETNDETHFQMVQGVQLTELGELKSEAVYTNELTVYNLDKYSEEEEDDE